MRVFEDYAPWYDLLNRDKPYEAEAAFVDRRLRVFGAAGGQLFEQGSGTGAHAFHMARRGWTVTGVDMSAAMVAQAERRATDEGLADRTRFSVGDVRDAGAERGLDAAISLFHVASYQTGEGDLARMVRAARTALRPGAVYLFDYWHGPAVLAQRPEIRVRRAGDAVRRVTRIAEPEHDGARNLVTVHFTLFCEDIATAEIRRVEEAHPMRYFMPGEIDPVLQAEGFEPMGHFAWMTDAAPDRDSWAAYAMARAQ